MIEEFSLVHRAQSPVFMASSSLQSRRSICFSVSLAASAKLFHARIADKASEAIAISVPLSIFGFFSFIEPSGPDAPRQPRE
jgi:hypothetical protein